MHHADRNIKSIRALLFDSGRAATVINFITLYRTIAFPVLLLLLFVNRLDVFKWFLLVSFMTDAVDGFLARRFKVTSILGARLDSIGDDLTIVAGLAGLLVARSDFIRTEMEIITVLFGLFAIQLASSLVRYRKISSFHTYLAKTAAVVTGVFMMSMFFLDEPNYPLFYAASLTTAIELIEEVILVFVIPEWRANVKGLYWVLKENGR